MKICACVKCKYVDLVDSVAGHLCMRCGGECVDLETNSVEWNKLSNDDMRLIINKKVNEYEIAHTILVQPEWEGEIASSELSTKELFDESNLGMRDENTNETVVEEKVITQSSNFPIEENEYTSPYRNIKRVESNRVNNDFRSDYNIIDYEEEKTPMILRIIYIVFNSIIIMGSIGNSNNHIITPLLAIVCIIYAIRRIINHGDDFNLFANMPIRVRQIIGIILVFVMVMTLGFNNSSTSSESNSTFVVPNVVGLSVIEASDILTNAGLKANAIYEESADYEKDTVMYQDIEPGTEVSAETKLNLVVSSGIENVEVLSESAEENDGKASWTKEKYEYPSEEEIINIPDVEVFYKNYDSVDDDKWYRLSGIVYEIPNKDEVMIHKDTDSILGIIDIHFANSEDIKDVKVGEKVTVVAHSEGKILSEIMMNSAYLDSAVQTSYSVSDDAVLLVEDYVNFWANYDDSYKGRKVQMTVPIDEVKSGRIYVKAGLDSGITSLICLEPAKDQSIVNLRPGEEITFYGVCGLKIMNTVNIDEVKLGETSEKTIPYKESNFYQQKQVENNEIGIYDVTLKNGQESIFIGNDVEIYVSKIKQSPKGFDVSFYIENNSNLNLNIYAHSYAVNSIMTGNNIYDMDCTVAAGKKANTTLTIKDKVLKELGITKIKNIDILFWAYDNAKSYKEFETPICHIETNLDDGELERITGENIYDSNGIAIDYLKSTGNEYSFVLTNNKGEYFDFVLRNLTINGFTSSDVDYDLYDEEVLKDCQYIMKVKVKDDFMKENDIDSVETIEFSLDYELSNDYKRKETTDMVFCQVK